VLAAPVFDIVAGTIYHSKQMTRIGILALLVSLSSSLIGCGEKTADVKPVNVPQGTNTGTPMLNPTPIASQKDARRAERRRPSGFYFALQRRHRGFGGY